MLKGPKHHSGFTLIELMIVIAILGILASIAIPAYQRYTIRTKVTEAIVAAGVARTAVADYYYTNSSFPTSRSDSGAFTLQTKYIRELTILGAGVIAIHIDEDETGVRNLTAVDMHIRMVPTVAPSALTWDCSVNSSPDGSGTTLIISQLVPSSCRN